MSKEDAEARFKVIQNAADDLLSKFDEEDEEGSRSSQPSQADSYEDDFEESDEFYYERNAGKEDEYDRHYNKYFPDMPSFDEFENMLGSRTGGPIRVSRDFVRWYSAKNAYEKRDRDSDDEEDFEGGLGCVVS